MKESNYFSHDFGARNDPKLLELQMEMGGQGLAIWWCLVEMLWENDGYLPLNYKTIAFSLRWASEADVKRVVEDFGLFTQDDEKFWNRSALSRIEKRNSATEAKREGGRRRAAQVSGQEKQDTSSIPAAYLQDSCSIAKANLKDTSSIPAAINKYIYKDINKESSSSIACAPAREQEQESVFELFFFKNFQNPAKEVERFFNYYNGNGWKWSDGKPVASVDAVARQWKPEDKDPRFADSVLGWFRKIYAVSMTEAKGWESRDLLKNIARAELKGSVLKIWMTTKSWSIALYEFVHGHGLDEDLNIDYKFINGKE